MDIMGDLTADKNALYHEVLTATRSSSVFTLAHLLSINDLEQMQYAMIALWRLLMDWYEATYALRLPYKASLLPGSLALTDELYILEQWVILLEDQAIGGKHSLISKEAAEKQVLWLWKDLVGKERWALAIELAIELAGERIEALWGAGVVAAEHDAERNLYERPDPEELERMGLGKTKGESERFDYA
jgi:hypothetical protein